MPLKHIESYWIGSETDLSGRQLHDLIGQFRLPAASETKTLNGRCLISRLQIDGIGATAIKSYRRGGMLRHLNRRHYLKLGKTRAQKEYELLQTVRRLRVNAPEPIAYAYRGRLLYSAWLITREIPRAISLAQLSLAVDRPVNTALKSTADQLARLIQNKIYHVDLHPGNVLIDENQNAFLVDFDKAGIFPGNRDRLRQRYLARWNRAVEKHGLPPALRDAICSEPASKYDRT